MVFQAWAHRGSIKHIVAGTQDWCMGAISSIVGLPILYIRS